MKKEKLFHKRTFKFFGVVFGSMLICVLHNACVTNSKYAPVSNIPTSLSTRFSDCKLGDGNLKVQVKPLTKEPSFSFEMDWVKTSEALEIQALNPMGINLFSFKYLNKADSSSQIIQAPNDFSNNLRIEKNGEINLDGSFLGVLIEEIPCILNGKLPARWLENLMIHSEEMQAKDSVSFYSFPDRRKIQIVATGLSDAKILSMCSLVKWSQYWGLVSRQLKICFRYSSKGTEIRMYDDEYFEVSAHAAEGE